MISVTLNINKLYIYMYLLVMLSVQCKTEKKLKNRTDYLFKSKIIGLQKKTFIQKNIYMLLILYIIIIFKVYHECLE